MDNRFFPVAKNHTKIKEMKTLCINGGKGSRESIDLTMILCKLPEDDMENHDCFDGIQEYTESQIEIEMKKAAWKGVIEN